MTEASSVRIGCWAGAWGDSPAAARQLLERGELDYLVGDHLAEITMALLARARAKDPGAGYVPDVATALVPMLAELSSDGVKVVTNGGGLNPQALADRLAAAADEARLELAIAHVSGDDVSGLLDELRAEGVRDMFTGEPLPDAALTANAYLGALPIAGALAAGADVVVTGRCADSAVVLGPLMHELGWSADDHDLLSAGTLIGHILECGTQGAGGLHTDWQSVPGWDDMGYPIAVCHPDGSAVISKPPGTGGWVTPATVAEQILYEIGDPGAYVMPDVVCDWREVQLEAAGTDSVRVSGARGTPPTPTYKTTVTSADGWRVLGTAMFAGGDAAARARRAGEAILARGERELRARGFAPLRARSVEVVGSGELARGAMSRECAREAVVKFAARHEEREALAILAREMAPLALVAQSMTGFTGGRPAPAPVIRLHHVLVGKERAPARFHLAGSTTEVAVPEGGPPPAGSAPLAEAPPEPRPGTVSVPLRAIAWGRSGDKGNDANVGLIARSSELAAPMIEQVSAVRVAELFGDWLEGEVVRWSLPGLNAINIVLRDALGGRGGTSSLRYDPQGKSFAAILLDMRVDVDPAALQSIGRGDRLRDAGGRR